MKVLTWNVAGRVQTTLGRQLEAVLRRAPDVVAMQELTAETYGDWRRGLSDAGYSIVDTKELVTLPYPPPPLPSEWFHAGQRIGTQMQRKNFNLTASRQPITPLPGLSFEDPDEARFAFPEKYCAARTTVDGRAIDIHNAHLPPGSSRGLIKVHAFEAVCKRVAKDADNPTILCGDFNAPLREDDAGPDVMAGHLARGPKWPEAVQARWIEAEAGIFKNPDLRDVYRDVHELGKPFPISHFTGRREPFTPHRYDYVFASREFNTKRCEYLTHWLERDENNWRPSDHAPVEAELSLPA